uniref:hypothetical protein n=1 Tax=Rickettsia sp. TH2014 TaxID=1967503 RepID=UPI001C441A57
MYINLTNQGITPKKLQKKLKDIKKINISSLDLTFNKLEKEGVKLLTKASCMQNLTSLYLGNN